MHSVVFQFLKFWFIICLYLSNLFYSGSIVASWPGCLYHSIYSNIKAKWQFTDIPTGTGNNSCFRFSRKFSVHMSYITELYLLLTNIIKGIINCCLRNSHPSPIHQSSILKFEDKICLENTLLVSKFLNSIAVFKDLLGGTYPFPSLQFCHQRGMQSQQFCTGFWSYLLLPYQVFLP